MRSLPDKPNQNDDANSNYSPRPRSRVYHVPFRVRHEIGATATGTKPTRQARDCVKNVGRHDARYW